MDHFLCFARFRGRASSEFLFQHLSCESRASKVLPQSIVQIMAQAPPFMIRHSSDLLIEPAPLSRFVFERRRPLLDASIKFPNERA
jgi:hypothetical protein